MAGGGLQVAVGGFVSGRLRLVSYVTSRGMRSSTMRKMAWSGQDVGRCRRIWVFISTTRAAILRRQTQRVELRDGKARAFLHRSAQALHQPIGAGMQE
jgi:hypothetical protein